MSRREEHQPESHPAPATDLTLSSAVRAPQRQGVALAGERSSRSRAPFMPAQQGTDDRGHGPGPNTTDLPETYGIDEVEILCKDPFWYFAYWEVTDSSLELARTQLGAAAKDAMLVLRVFISTKAGGPSGREIRDFPVQAQHGRRYLEVPRLAARLRVAVGLLSPEGYFAPIAHSSLVRIPPQQPSPDTSIEWLHVLPPRGDGQQHERIMKGGLKPEHRERAVTWQTGALPSVSSLEEGLYIPSPAPPGGASEMAQRRGNDDSDGRRA